METKTYIRKKISIEKLQLLYSIIQKTALTPEVQCFYTKYFLMALEQEIEILKSIKKSFEKNKLQSVKINEQLINFIIQNTNNYEEIAFLSLFLSIKK
jgi:hypothetical protein